MKLRHCNLLPDNFLCLCQSIPQPNWELTSSIDQMQTATQSLNLSFRQVLGFPLHKPQKMECVHLMSVCLSSMRITFDLLHSPLCGALFMSFNLNITVSGQKPDITALLVFDFLCAPPFPSPWFPLLLAMTALYLNNHNVFRITVVQNDAKK